VEFVGVFEGNLRVVFQMPDVVVFDFFVFGGVVKI
jgi:hypothetical protein